MSNIELDAYLENKVEQFEEIIQNKEWEAIDDFYRDMENEGWGQYVPQISEIMTDEDIKDYKVWDLETNGSMETQMQ